MKKTIKTADLLAYLTSEIEACEAAAERYCRALDIIDKGEYTGRNPVEKEKERLNAHLLFMEHRIDAFGSVKRDVYYKLAKDEKLTEADKQIKEADK